MGALLLRSQSQFSAYGIDSKEDPVTLPHLAAQSQMQSGADWSGTGTRGMRLEFHQLERRLEHLRVRRPERQRRLLTSLAASGQQTPIVVVAAEQADRYLVIDGYQRIAALQQLAGTRWRRWSGR
jgi:hypothetical protein